MATTTAGAAATAKSTESTETTETTGPTATDEEPSGLGAVVAAATAQLDRADRFQQQHPRLALPLAVVKKFGDDDAGNLAALVAHYSFFSLFPLLLVLATVLQYVLAGRPELASSVLDSALGNFPIVGDQLRDIGTVQGSGIALAIGIVGALWGGLGAVDAMQRAMNRVWGVPLRSRPNLLSARLRSLGMVGLLGGSIVATTLVASVATIVDGAPVGGRLLVVPVAVLVNVGLFVGSFTILTDADIGWRAHVPGAVIAGVAFSILQVIGSWYVEHVVDGASEVYGTFAIVLGLLSWLHLQAQVTLYAAELNAVRHHTLYPRSLVGPALTVADRRALESYARIEERHPDEQIVVDLSGAPEAGSPTS